MGTRARTLAFAIICSLLASVSPLYTTLMTSGSVRCIKATAVHKTRSPPPPALLYASSKHAPIIADNDNDVLDKAGHTGDKLTSTGERSL